MFTSTLKSAAKFKTIMDAISEIIDCVLVNFSESGLVLQAMDSSHVSLCCLNLLPGGFETYECDQKSSVGLNVANTNKILKCASPDDSLTLKLDNSDVININVYNEGKKKFSHFELLLMDIEQDHLDIPDSEYDCMFSMKSTEFQKIIKDLMNIGDSCRIKSCETGVTFQTSGDIGKASMNISDDVVISGFVDLQFSLKYLSIFTKATSLSQHVNIKMTENSPMCLEYDMGDLGSLKYFLAPKIDDDDEM